MGICWYCHWGWAEPMVEIYERGCEKSSAIAMHYGPGHIVWEDENFETENLQWCIDNAEKYRGDLSDDELQAVVASLKEALEIPEEIRCCEPKDYDDDKPENHPPAEGTVRRHRSMW